jgi:hypothetical protein
VKKVSIDEVERFAEKLQAYREHEKGKIELQGLYYSFNGFQGEAIARLHELNIYWWDFDTLDRLS